MDEAKEQEKIQTRNVREGARVAPPREDASLDEERGKTSVEQGFQGSLQGGGQPEPPGASAAVEKESQSLEEDGSFPDVIVSRDGLIEEIKVEASTVLELVGQHLLKATPPHLRDMVELRLLKALSSWDITNHNLLQETDT